MLKKKINTVFDMGTVYLMFFFFFFITIKLFSHTRVYVEIQLIVLENYNIYLNDFSLVFKLVISDSAVVFF